MFNAKPSTIVLMPVSMKQKPMSVPRANARDTGFLIEVSDVILAVDINRIKKFNPYNKKEDQVS